MHTWHVSSVRRLVQPVPQPGRKGITGFTVNRPYAVSLAEPASTVGLPRVEGAIAALPFTRKRGTTESHEGAKKAKGADCEAC